VARRLDVVAHSETALLVYDGDCGFCSASAQWIAAKWPNSRTAEVVPWQRLGEEGLARFDLTTADAKKSAWWIEEGRTFGAHLAIGRALAAATGAWALLGRALLIPPLRWLAAAGYPVVARYRYRLPGATPACKV
jgi:predicted DCC family thiol-disulfide oxidoreductase YuxK